MLKFIARRILYSIPVLVLSSLIVFWGIRQAFDPTAKYRTSRDAARIIAEKRKELGLDRPIIAQWWTWATKFVRGDWGVSSNTGDRVSTMVSRALGYTVQLIFWGVLISLIIAVLVGVYSAVKQYSVGDYIFTGLSYLGIAMPPFWFALLMIQFLSVWPNTHWDLDHPIFYFVNLHSTHQSGIFNLDYYRHLALPVLTLTVQSVAVWSRFQRAAMLDVLGADYIRTARAKGLSRRRVVWKHALRNALLPLVSQTAVDAAALFGGLLITEQIFSIPGMGRLFLAALQTGDVYTLLAWMLVGAVFVILFNLLADIVYGFLDPRIRVQ
jgi:peptide/nickel transport system permease protein